MADLLSRKITIQVIISCLLIMTSCSSSSETTLVPISTLKLSPTITATEDPINADEKNNTTPDSVNEDSPADTEYVDDDNEINADVVSVTVSGLTNQYQFSVGISSPDTGCEQYADWWEVLNEDGELIYRRILLHSHVNDQPFTRSGGPIDIKSDEVVIIRAHMNEAGYGGTTMIGSVKSGFKITELLPDFATGVENEPPLPTGCNF